MKQFKLALVLLASVVLTSCGPEGEAEIENNLVVQQVEKTKSNSGCESCLENSYAYKVRLKSYSGDVYYYTDYKHEVGDTLLSIFEFTDSRDGIIKSTEATLDSVIVENGKMRKKNDELELYNSLLMGIIQENAMKDK